MIARVLHYLTFAFFLKSNVKYNLLSTGDWLLYLASRQETFDLFLSSLVQLDREMWKNIITPIERVHTIMQVN